MKKFVGVMAGIILSVCLCGTCFASGLLDGLGESLGDFFTDIGNDIKEEYSDDFNEIKDDYSEIVNNGKNIYLETIENWIDGVQDGNPLGVMGLLEAVSGAQTKKETLMDIAAYIVDESDGDTSGLGDLLRAVGRLMSAITNNEPGEIVAASGDILDALLKMDESGAILSADMSVMTTEKLFKIYSLAQEELINRGELY